MVISDVGVYLTFLISWLIAVISFIQFFFYFKVQPRCKNCSVLFFSLFWLGIGIVWLLVGVEEIALAVGRVDIAVNVFYSLEILVGAVILLIFMYLASKFSKKLWRTLIIFFASAGVLIFEELFIRYGHIERPSGAFSRHMLVNSYARDAFGILFAFAFALLIVDSVRLYINRDKKVGGRNFRFSALAAASLAIVAIAGSFDQLGIVEDWTVTLSRIITLAAALVALVAVYELTYPEGELVV